MAQLNEVRNFHRRNVEALARGKLGVLRSSLSLSNVENLRAADNGTATESKRKKHRPSRAREQKHSICIHCNVTFSRGIVFFFGISPSY